ncbi:thioredoxin [Flavobacterium noncentrifugens]|uniref:Thioredoxin n=1 Tax=Flavobacterium noncentrifugens TaxID=1128970 RepID=A0A1G9ALC8_9FLAO|nr:thioredoxin family protein [Flavobacterium noncentrifugens]GEP51498.1 thioredoxin [Flavobacterium noncentrifugens]SDK28142.1 Thioredoxin [Flavobacterium noncentrifugens]
MKVAVAESLLKSHSYVKYRTVVSNLLKQGKSSGNQQSEALTHYSELNEARMNRLDKKTVIFEENIQKLLTLKSKYTWLVLSEGWCGDAAQILPILNKLAVITPNIDLKIVFRDENEALMTMFLTNGGKAIPKLIVLDEASKNTLGNWGPRPKGASDLIQSYKRQYGVLDETAKTELQLWYLHDKGISTQNELVTMMLNLDQMNFQTV